MQAAESTLPPGRRRAMPRAERRVAPTRRRFDPDRLVGLAFLVALPVALWFW